MLNGASQERIRNDFQAKIKIYIKYEIIIIVDNVV